MVHLTVLLEEGAEARPVHAEVLSPSQIRSGHLSASLRKKIENGADPVVDGGMRVVDEVAVDRGVPTERFTPWVTKAASFA